MTKYNFFGHENCVKIRSKNMNITPCDLYDILKNIWCEYSCAPRMRQNWSDENITLGQCSITAFLVQDIFGGKVFGVPRPDGNFHCFNVVDDVIFDLTSEQFKGEFLDYSLKHEQSREKHFSKDEKKQRYEYLKSELEKVYNLF